MALKGNGTTEFAAWTSQSVTRWSFSAHMRHTAAPTTTEHQPIAIGGSVDIFGFSWDHSTVGFRQAIYQRQSSGAYVACKLTSTISADTWYVISGYYDGTNVTAWLNGTKEATTASADPGTATTPLFHLFRGNSTNYFAGYMAFAGAWNVALSDAEMASLGKGAHPLSVRRQSLIHCADLTRDTRSPIAAPSAQTGLATVLENPRIFMPQRSRTYFGVSQSQAPRSMHQYRMRRVA